MITLTIGWLLACFVTGILGMMVGLIFGFFLASMCTVSKAADAHLQDE